MSEKINDGGPAFPQNDLSTYNMGPAEKNNGGMTLRDWFAGQALAGFMAGYFANPDNGDLENDEIAMFVYEQADAMIAAREASE